ncbi:MAG: hypothetical protein AABP62_14365 [Planctomycetota bacterium]
MSTGQIEQNQFTTKAAEARDAATRLAKVTQAHAELLEGFKKDGSLGDSPQWPCVWAGAIASSFGGYAFTTDWTGGAPHPFWTAGAHPTGKSWSAWLTATWAGAGAFFEDPANYFGKPVWANLAGGAGGGGEINLYLYKSNGGPLIGQFGAVCTGLGGCNIWLDLTYTNAP